MEYSMNNREFTEKQYGHLYKTLKIDGEPFTCVYCGDHAHCLDQVPPLSRVSDYQSFNLNHMIYLKVPACNECNLMLGNSLQSTFDERIDYCKELIKEEYENDLKNTWTKTKIKKGEFTGKLKHVLEQTRSKQEWIQQRLIFNGGYKAWMNFIADNPLLEVREEPQEYIVDKAA